MKKIMKIALCALLGFAISSCGSSNRDNDKNNEDNVEIHKHSFEYVPLKDATCTEEGNAPYWHCKTCNKNYWNADGIIEIADLIDTQIKPLGHDLVKHEGTRSTCTVDGISEHYTCKRCERIFTDSSANFEVNDLSVITAKAKGHDLTYHSRVEPTCTNKGMREYRSCSECEKNFYLPEGNFEVTNQEELVISALGHLKTDYLMKDENSHWYACARCFDKLEANEHNWNEGNLVIEGTCTTKHATEFTCSTCGQTKIEIEEASGHVFSSDYIGDEEEHWHECEKCHVKTDIASHDYKKTGITREASCLISGIEEYTCKECNKVVTKEIPILDHNYAGAFEHDDSTHWQRCTMCGQKGNVVAHRWGNETVTKEPSFTEDGIKHLTCLDCALEKDVIFAKSELIYMLSADGTYYILLGMNSEEENINLYIPDEYNGLPIKEIGPKAFANNQQIISVTLGNNIEMINNNAFYECHSLANVTLSNKLVEVGYQAFWNCYNLKSLTFPDLLKRIESHAFGYCQGEGFNTAILPENLEYLGSSAFTGCYNLKNVTYGDKLNVLDAYTFCGTSIEEITIKSNIKVIGNSCFAGCSNLRKIIFEDPNGWEFQDYPNYTSIDFSDPSLNAFLLKGTYSDYNFYKDRVE